MTFGTGRPGCRRVQWAVAAEKWLTWAAYATWLVVGLPTLSLLVTGRFGGPPAVMWVAAYAMYGAALGVCLYPLPAQRRSRSLTATLLLMQSAAALTIIALTGNGTAGALLVIVAAQAAGVFPPRIAWTWAAVQTLLLAIAWARFEEWLDVLSLAGSFGGFQAFAMAAMWLARSEREARQQLAHTHGELVATQSLLAENSRVAERLRISRDLHDTLGHHLTALSLQLDVASRLTSGQGAEHVREAHAITRLLLADVRDVVSRMRDSSQVDLAQSLRALARGSATPQIHLDMPNTLQMDDPEQAHALFSSVREIVTNAARHGGARNLWIRIAQRADGIDLYARDDGRGATELQWGHGLRGMRERFEEFSGRVDVTPGPGRGFEVHGFMPRAEPAS